MLARGAEPFIGTVLKEKLEAHKQIEWETIQEMLVEVPISGKTNGKSAINC
jgi:hypothetical protein